MWAATRRRTSSTRSCHVLSTVRTLCAPGGPAVRSSVPILARHMARDWRELFITPDGAPAPEPETEDTKRGFFRRLRDNMSKSRQALGAELQASVFQTLDDDTWERLEETLIYADVGASTTAKIVERLETE